MSNEPEEKKTSDEIASKASEVLRDGRTADDSKSVAGSALSQVQGGSTSDEVAKKASDVMQSDEHSDTSKSVAASALSQTSSEDENDAEE